MSTPDYGSEVEYKPLSPVYFCKDAKYCPPPPTPYHRPVPYRSRLPSHQRPITPFEPVPRYPHWHGMLVLHFHTGKNCSFSWNYTSKNTDKRGLILIFGLDNFEKSFYDTVMRHAIIVSIPGTNLGKSTPSKCWFRKRNPVALRARRISTPSSGKT